MSSAMFALEMRAERASGGVESGVVQRRRARDAANPVGSKKLFGHWEKPVSPEYDPGPVGPTSASMTSAKLSTRNKGALAVGSGSCLLHQWDNLQDKANESFD